MDLNIITPHGLERGNAGTRATFSTTIDSANLTSGKCSSQRRLDQIGRVDQIGLLAGAGVLLSIGQPGVASLHAALTWQSLQLAYSHACTCTCVFTRYVSKFSRIPEARENQYSALGVRWR